LSGIKPPLFSQAKVIRGAGMKRAGYVQGGVRAEQKACGIEKIHIRAGYFRADESVDPGWLAAGYPADDMDDRRRPGERGAFPGIDRELAETVEEIPAELLSEGCVDGIIGAVQSGWGTQCAIC
jgi:hypothetical protein